MPISHLLQDFTPAPTPDSPMTLLSEVALEDRRLAAFEQGYTAGWEDAVEAQKTNQTQVLAALGDQLQDLSFTYQEAQSHLWKSVTPVLDLLVAQVLPQVMQETIAPLIVQEVLDVMHNEAEQPVCLVVPEGASEALKSVLSKQLSMPVELKESASLQTGQAFLKFSDAEREVDMVRVLEEARGAIKSFAYEVEKEVSYG